MSIRKEEIVNKLELLKKQKKDFKKDNLYFWFVGFMVLAFILITVVAVWCFLI